MICDLLDLNIGGEPRQVAPLACWGQYWAFIRWCLCASLPFTLYLVAITLACVAIMMLAALDAWATRQNFLRLRSEQLATQIKLSRELGIESSHDSMTVDPFRLAIALVPVQLTCCC